MFVSHLLCARCCSHSAYTVPATYIISALRDISVRQEELQTWRLHGFDLVSNYLPFQPILLSSAEMVRNRGPGILQFQHMEFGRRAQLFQHQGQSPPVWRLKPLFCPLGSPAFGQPTTLVLLPPRGSSCCVCFPVLGG